MIHYSLPINNSGSEEKRFFAIDISLPPASFNVAEIMLRGRYPENGFALNKESEMVVKILEGSTIFQCEREEILLPKGSIVLVQINKSYCWIPQEYVKLHIVSTPPWTIEQHENVLE